jgi:hypothetical protein
MLPPHGVVRGHCPPRASAQGCRCQPQSLRAAHLCHQRLHAPTPARAAAPTSAPALSAASSSDLAQQSGCHNADTHGVVERVWEGRWSSASLGVALAMGELPTRLHGLKRVQPCPWPPRCPRPLGPKPCATSWGAGRCHVLQGPTRGCRCSALGPHGPAPPYPPTRPRWERPPKVHGPPRARDSTAVGGQAGKRPGGSCPYVRTTSVTQ